MGSDFGALDFVQLVKHCLLLCLNILLSLLLQLTLLQLPGQRGILRALANAGRTRSSMNAWSAL